MKDKYFFLNYSTLPKLSEAPKDKSLEGAPLKDGEVSAWAFTLAASCFERGAPIKVEDFQKELKNAIIWQDLLKLVDLGLVDLTLDHDNDIVAIVAET